MKRRILSILLTLTMVISLVPGLTVTAGAAEGDKVIDSVEFDIDWANMTSIADSAEAGYQFSGNFLTANPDAFAAPAIGMWAIYDPVKYPEEEWLLLSKYKDDGYELAEDSVIGLMFAALEADGYKLADDVTLTFTNLPNANLPSGGEIVFNDVQSAGGGKNGLMAAVKLGTKAEVDALLSSGAGHNRHCVCGSSNSCGESHNAATAWEAWESTTSLPANAGYYYLTEDVTISSNWTPARGTFLCLNGKVVTLNNGSSIYVDKGAFTLTDCDTSTQHCFTVDSNGLWTLTNTETENSVIGGVITGSSRNAVTVETASSTMGSFTMYGGNIVGNGAPDFYRGGGIYVYGTQATIYGGSIRGNVAQNGAGICALTPNASIRLYGGAISDNTATVQGGGIFSAAGVEVMGAPVVNGNWKTASSAPMPSSASESASEPVENNVEIGISQASALEEPTNNIPLIELSGKLTEDAEIGVTIATSDFFTRYWGYIMESEDDPADYFFSDNPDYTVVREIYDPEGTGEGVFELRLGEGGEQPGPGGEPTTYSVTIVPAANGTVTASPTTAAAGDTVTLTVTPAICYELQSLTVEDAQGNEVTVTNNQFIMPESNVTATAVFAAVESAAGIYPYGQDMTYEGLTLHIGVAGENYQWQVADAADSSNWKPLKVEVEGELVDATEASVTFTPAQTDLWYRCVVDGVPSEAVQAIQAGYTEYEFTNASGRWYLSNGSMAYFVYGSCFDVVGKFVGRYDESEEPATYWANTSFDGYWCTGSDSAPTPGNGNYSNNNLKSIVLNFDTGNARHVLVEFKLKDDYTAAAFGTDTELGDSLLSSNGTCYDDNCSLKAVFAGNNLKHIQMVAAKSLEDADPENELSMVITPITPNAIFWIGAYGQEDAQRYNGIGEAYGYNEGSAYNREVLEDYWEEYWEEYWGEPWEAGLTYNDYFNKAYSKDGPEGYEGYVTEIQKVDSALALSWTGMQTDLIQFTFSVGTVAQTGASISSLTSPTGSIDVTVDAGATISVKMGEEPLVEGTHYTVTGTAPNYTITFMDAAGITCQSVLKLGVAVSGGEPVWQTIPNSAHNYEANSWEKDSSQHYRVCTVCDTPASYAGHSYSWVQGATQHHQQCSVCAYTTTPADHAYVDGTCVCGKAEAAPPPSRPSSSGGSYTPPTVDVPMSNDESKVDVKAEVSGKDATIKPLSNQQIEELVGDEAASGDVVVDLSDLGKEIDTAGIPKATLEAIVDAAEDAGNATEHLVIKLTTAELKLDDAAMRAIVDQASGNIIKFNFDDVGTDRLNYKQKEAVKDMDVRKGFEAYITVNGQRISDFKGGNVEITVPYEVPAGESLAAYSVWYIDEQGNPEKLKSTYDGKNNWFVVTHFSDYVIAYNKADADVTNCPKDETCPIDPFTDTKNRAWYHDGVHYCIENGLMVGNGSDLFQPNGITTRAQIVTILWRMEGSPVVENAKDFDDVAARKWYYNAVRWASANEIVEGYDNGLFAPNDSITREQLAAILYRYCQYKGIDVSVGEETNILSYEDAIGIRKWAIPGLQWACGSGMIQGIEKNGTMYLDPKGSAVRSQSATIIYRLCTELYK